MDGRLMKRGFAAVLLLALTGCVERRYTIRSDPPGAIAIVNDEEIGPTPVSHSFTYYGDRRVRLQREGFETLDVVQPVEAPWWDNGFTEFFTENLTPLTFRDEREFVYRLNPTRNADSGDLISRAEAVRSQGATAPPPRSRGFWSFLGF